MLYSLCLLLLPAPADVQASRLAVVDKMPAFSLTAQSGKPFDSKTFEGKVSLVAFMFATCNGTCPATTHRLCLLQHKLRDHGLLKDGRVQFVSITLDPTRDTPEVLRGYARLYDIDTANWVFLTGEPAQVGSTIAAWGMWARPAPGGQLDHPSRIFLVDTRRRIREIYSLSFLRPAWVAEDVKLLLNERAGSHLK